MTSPAEKLAMPVEDHLRVAYQDRARAAALWAALFPATLCANDPHLPTMPVLYVETPEGQVSWHIHPDELGEFPHVPVVAPDAPDAPVWDGHSTAEKNARLRRVVTTISRRARPADAARVLVLGPRDQVLPAVLRLGQSTPLAVPAAVAQARDTADAETCAVIDVVPEA